MDPVRLAVTFAVLAIGLGIGRLVVGTFGRTGDVMATLFVPPDRALGWPRGVQESDEPWGWRSRGRSRARAVDEAGDHPGDPPGSEISTDAPKGTFVVPVERVRRR